ncbi:hypothetical protein FSC37_13985 [Piscinibacter aquaticus]|uniref:Exonuclease domain-containing protein n=1 Tax=Piscinibacter aquaticus TaxID=392597 RepID=A0A5C6U457_9BURK|nr:hypothetical protein FSC37_13985 [Piscinibacter aquaticus]
MIGWWAQRRRQAADDGRWVVLDVESSGLDPKRDRLLAIAAVGLRRAPEGPPRVVMSDSFEVVLRQQDAPVDKANILVHGIGIGAQRQGVEPAQALEAFERWVGAAPLIGFHVAFDEALIQRAMRAVLGRTLANPWIDRPMWRRWCVPTCPGARWTSGWTRWASAARCATSRRRHAGHGRTAAAAVAAGAGAEARGRLAGADSPWRPSAAGCPAEIRVRSGTWQ